MTACYRASARSAAHTAQQDGSRPPSTSTITLPPRPHVRVFDDPHQLLQLVGVVVAARQTLLQRGDSREAVLLHDSAQLRRQRDVSLRREFQQLVVLELLHEGGHVVL